MEWTINKKTLRNIILIVFGGIILYWLLHESERVKFFKDFVSGITAPFVLGGVLAFILNVPMRAFENGILKKLKNQNWKRTIAVVLTFIAMLLVLAIVFWLLIPQVVSTFNSLIPNLYEFLEEAENKIRDFLGDNPKLMEWLVENTEWENFSWESMLEKSLNVIGTGVSAIVSGAISALGSVFNGLYTAIIAIVFSVYCLFQKETLARQGRKLVYAFTKEKTADNIIRILRLTNSTFSNFLSGQCVEVCILGLLFAISMAIFRMPYIPLISVVIAVTAFIPIVGAWTGCVLGAFLILVEDPLQAVWFVIMFLIVQQFENSIIYPRVVGNSVGLSGMWVLVAVAFGGELMGVVGMFLMIPVVSVIYTLIQEITNKRLSSSTVDPEKLQPQPPELYSRFKEKRAENKKKRQLRWLERKLNRLKRNENKKG